MIARKKEKKLPGKCEAKKPRRDVTASMSMNMKKRKRNKKTKTCPASGRRRARGGT